MSSLTVISRIVPLSFPPEEYPSFFKDLNIESYDCVQKTIFEDGLTKESYSIETIYIKEDLSKLYEDDPNFAPLTSDSKLIQNAHNLDECKGFSFSVPLHIRSISPAHHHDHAGLNTDNPAPYRQGRKVNSLYSPKPNSEHMSAIESQEVKASSLQNSSFNSYQKAKDINASPKSLSVRAKLTSGLFNKYSMKSYVNKHKNPLHEKPKEGFYSAKRSLSFHSDSKQGLHANQKSAHPKMESHTLDKFKKYRSIAPKSSFHTKGVSREEEDIVNKNSSTNDFPQWPFHDKKENKSVKSTDGSHDIASVVLSEEVKPVGDSCSFNKFAPQPKFFPGVKVTRLSGSSSEDSDNESAHDEVIYPVESHQKGMDKRKGTFGNNHSSPLSKTDPQAKFLDKNLELGKKIIVNKSGMPDVCSDNSNKLKLDDEKDACTEAKSPSAKLETNAPELVNSGILSVVNEPPINQKGIIETADSIVDSNEDVQKGSESLQESDPSESLQESDPSALCSNSQIKNSFQIVMESDRGDCKQENLVKNFEKLEEAVTQMDKKEANEKLPIDSSVLDCTSLVMEAEKNDVIKKDLVQDLPKLDSHSDLVKDKICLHSAQKDNLGKHKSMMKKCSKQCLSSVRSSILKKASIRMFAKKTFSKTSKHFTSSSVRSSVENQVIKEVPHSQEFQMSSEIPNELNNNCEKSFSDKNIRKNKPSFPHSMTKPKNHDRAKLNGSKKADSQKSVSESSNKKILVQIKIASAEKDFKDKKNITENLPEMSNPLPCSFKHQKVDLSENVTKICQNVDRSTPGSSLKNSLGIKTPSPDKLVKRTRALIEDIQKPLFSNDKKIEENFTQIDDEVKSSKSVLNSPIPKKHVDEKNLSCNQKIIKKTKIVKNIIKPHISSSDNSSKVLEKVTDSSFKSVDSVESVKSVSKCPVPNEGKETLTCQKVVKKSKINESTCKPCLSSPENLSKVSAKPIVLTKNTLSPNIKKMELNQKLNIDSCQPVISCSKSQGLVDKEMNTNIHSKKVKDEKNDTSSSKTCSASPRKSSCEEAFNREKITKPKKSNKLSLSDNDMAAKAKLVSNGSSLTTSGNLTLNDPTGKSLLCHKKFVKKKVMTLSSSRSIPTASVNVTKVKKTSSKEPCQLKFQGKFSKNKKLIKLIQNDHKTLLSKLPSSSDVKLVNKKNVPSSKAGKTQQVKEKPALLKYKNKPKASKEQAHGSKSEENVVKKPIDNYVPSQKSRNEMKKTVKAAPVCNQKGGLSDKSRKISHGSSGSKQVVQKSSNNHKMIADNINLNRPNQKYSASKHSPESKSVLKKIPNCDQKIDQNDQTVKDIQKPLHSSEEKQLKKKNTFSSEKYIKKHLKRDSSSFGEEEPLGKKRKYSKNCESLLYDPKLNKEDRVVKKIQSV